MEIHRHQEKLDFLFEELEHMLKQYPNLYVDRPY